MPENRVQFTKGAACLPANKKLQKKLAARF